MTQPLSALIERNNPDELVQYFASSLDYKNLEARKLVKERIVSLLMTSPEPEKQQILLRLEVEIAKCIDQTKTIRFYRFRTFIPFTRAAALSQKIFSLWLFRSDNPYTNRGYYMRHATSVWFQCLGIIAFIAAGEGVLAWASSPAPQTFVLSSDLTISFSFRDWIFCMIAGLLGAWFPFGFTLFQDHPLLHEEYTLRAQICAMMVSACLISTLFPAFLSCFHPALIETFIDPAKKELFTICMCALIGSGDMVLLNIMQRALQASFFRTRQT